MSVFDRFRVDGKKLLITGGSRGLGREMVLAIAEAGADVIVTGRREDSLKQIAKEVEYLGRQCWTIQADMNAPDECERVCENVIAEHGSVDILINNVGGRREDIPTEEMSLAKWRELMDLNLTSTFVCTSRIGKAMIAAGNGGRVINIGSINSLVAGRNIAGRHYETAKGAILQFTRSVAADWAPYGITVNAISPGPIEGDYRDEAMGAHIREQEKLIPLGHLGKPMHIAGLCGFLVSEEGGFVSGQMIACNGATQT